jgi:hypothetical protein
VNSNLVQQIVVLDSSSIGIRVKISAAAAFASLNNRMSLQLLQNLFVNFPKIPVQLDGYLIETFAIVSKKIHRQFALVALSTTKSTAFVSVRKFQNATVFLSGATQLVNVAVRQMSTIVAQKALSLIMKLVDAFARRFWSVLR